MCCGKELMRERERFRGEALTGAAVRGHRVGWDLRGHPLPLGHEGRYSRVSQWVFGNGEILAWWLLFPWRINKWDSLLDSRMTLEKSVKLWICYWAERKECVCYFPPKPTPYSYSSYQWLAPVNQDKNLEIIFPTPIAQQSSHTSTSFISMEPVFSPTLLHLFAGVVSVDSKLICLIRLICLFSFPMHPSYCFQTHLSKTQ